MSGLHVVTRIWRPGTGADNGRVWWVGLALVSRRCVAKHVRIVLESLAAMLVEYSTHGLLVYLLLRLRLGRRGW